jgi:nucleoid-associated protein YgaU
MADNPAKDPAGKEKVGPKKGGKLDKYKWWIVGALGLVAVLVFFFVSRSNSNAAGTAGTTGGTTLDPATQAALESALQAQAAGGLAGAGSAGGVGDTGATGATGAAGPPGPTGPTGPAGKPAPSPKPKPKPKPKTGSNTKWYTVKSGDTLSGIASKFNYKGGWHALYSANRGVVGSNPNLIHPGMRLKV